MDGGIPFGSTPLGGAPTSYNVSDDYYEDVSLFLPLEIRNPDENKYFQTHVKAFIDNQNSNNDYALLALHQLFMFVVYGLLYSCIRRDVSIAQKVFALTPVRSGERKQLQEISSLFTLSLLNERSIFQLMEVFGCKVVDDMGKLKSLVDSRNLLAHCNGSLCLDFDGDIKRYLNGLEILHTKFAPIITKHLLDINNIDFGVPQDGRLDQLKTIVDNNSISQRMIELATPPVGKNGLTKRSNQLLISYSGN